VGETTVLWLNCSEYTPKSDSHHTPSRRHRHGAHAAAAGPHQVPAPLKTAAGGAPGSTDTAPTAATDDGTMSDSAMLFGQTTDDRRRHKTNADPSSVSKSSASASSKTSSGILAGRKV